MGGCCNGQARCRELSQRCLQLEMARDDAGVDECNANSLARRKGESSPTAPDKAEKEELPKSSRSAATALASAADGSMETVKNPIVPKAQAAQASASKQSATALIVQKKPFSTAQ